MFINVLGHISAPRTYKVNKPNIVVYEPQIIDRETNEKVNIVNYNKNNVYYIYDVVLNLKDLSFFQSVFAQYELSDNFRNYKSKLNKAIVHEMNTRFIPSELDSTQISLPVCRNDYKVVRKEGVSITRGEPETFDLKRDQKKIEDVNKAVTNPFMDERALQLQQLNLQKKGISVLRMQDNVEDADEDGDSSVDDDTLQQRLEMQRYNELQTKIGNAYTSEMEAWLAKERTRINEEVDRLVEYWKAKSAYDEMNVQLHSGGGGIFNAVSGLDIGGINNLFASDDSSAPQYEPDNKSNDLLLYTMPEKMTNYEKFDAEFFERGNEKAEVVFEGKTYKVMRKQKILLDDQQENEKDISNESYVNPAGEGGNYHLIVENSIYKRTSQ